MEEKPPYLGSEQFEELKAREIRFINQNGDRPEQEGNGPRPITGLSLSGGGIRSAVFNLGVLQALAKLQQKLLDYLRRRGNYLTPGDNYTLLTLLAVGSRTGMLDFMTWEPLISLIMHCAYQLAYVATLSLQSTIIGITLSWDYLLYFGIGIALIDTGTPS